MNKLAQLITEESGLNYDVDNNVYYGEKGGYHFVYEVDQNNLATLSVSVTNGDFPSKEIMKKAKEECPAISGFSLLNYRVSFTIKKGLSKTKVTENLKSALEFLPGFLRRENYTDCSEISGQTADIGVYCLGGAVKILSAEEFRQSSEVIMQKEEGKKLRSENVIGGIVGAFLGSLIGCAAILIISKLGYVSVIGGIIMGVCTIKGYELLSGKFTKKGIVFSLIIMIGMTYFSNHMSFAIEVEELAQLGLMETFRYLTEMLEANNLMHFYWEELAKLALFTAIGAVPSIFVMAKSKKVEGHAYKLGENRIRDYSSVDVE